MNIDKIMEKIIDKLNPTDGFQMRLFAHIMEFHPYMESDPGKTTELIINQSKDAGKVFRRHKKNSTNTNSVALEQADKILFSGLEFSPIAFISSVAMQQNIIISSKATMLDIYKDMQPLFQNHENSEKQLVEKIKQYLKRKL